MNSKINQELYQHLKDFKETRRTVNELLNYKKSVMGTQNYDYARVNEIKSKAINAINNLFKAEV